MRLGASAASGLLLSLAFPPVDAGEVAFVAMIPFVLALRGASWRAAGLCGLSFGAAFFGVLLHWIALFGVAALVGLLVLESLFVAAAAVLAVPALRLGPAARVAGFALAWTALEMLRVRYPLGGFGWGGVGYTQHDGGLALGLARLGGVHLSTFAIVAVNALLAETLVATSARRRVALATAAVALVFAPASLPVGLAGSATGSIDIAAVQGNVPRGRFSVAGRHGGRTGPEDVTIVRNHIRVTERLLGSPPPDLVVWPENAFDRDPRTNPALLQPTLATLRRVGAPLLTGAILDEDEGYTNSNLLIHPDGRIAGRYDKIHLVPFGEYVPWDWPRRVVPILAREVPIDGIAGDRPVVFDVGGKSVGSVICFESTYPQLVREAVRAGAEIVIVTTNNASFGTSPAAREHLAMSRLRAVEQGRAVVHAAIAGVSAIVLPDGRVIERAGLFEPALLRTRLPLARELTPYARYGRGIEIALGLLPLGFALAGVAGRTPRAPAARRQTQPLPAAPSVVVVLPTYNEAETIREVVHRALASSAAVDVLVVDDSSPDGTGAIADEIAASEPRVRVLHRPGKAGLGPAYIAGFGEALRRGADIVVEMDADLSHDPADIARLVEAAQGADAVIGSRWVPGGDTHNWTRSRVALSRGGNAYARLLLGLPIADATSGFRLYRRAVLEAIPLGRVRSEGYAFQVEMVWRAWREGFRVVEIPIVFVERRVGASKMSRRIVLEAVVSIARWALWGDRDAGRSRASRP